MNIKISPPIYNSKFMTKIQNKKYYKLGNYDYDHDHDHDHKPRAR